jgi:hypothetical protein
MHRILAYRMLHNAVIGKLGVESQEMSAFLNGFRLPVLGGLSFCQVRKEFIYTVSLLTSYKDCPQFLSRWRVFYLPGVQLCGDF